MRLFWRVNALTQFFQERCEKLEAELTEANKQLKYSKEGIMAEVTWFLRIINQWVKGNDAFVMVIEKIQSALSKVDESIVYSNYPGFDIFENLEVISLILDEAVDRSRFLLGNKNKSLFSSV